MATEDHISQEVFNEKHGHFRISEFCITGAAPPRRIAAAILSDHIVPMNKVRKALGAPVLVSKRSGYRPRAYEVLKNRPGTSQHNFEDTHPTGSGAADYTCAVAKELVPLLIEHTNYTRICHYYNHNFVHCDHKPTPSGKREVYICASPTSKWYRSQIIT